MYTHYKIQNGTSYKSLREKFWRDNYFASKHGYEHSGRNIPSRVVTLVGVWWWVAGFFCCCTSELLLHARKDRSRCLYYSYFKKLTILLLFCAYHHHHRDDRHQEKQNCLNCVLGKYIKRIHKYNNMMMMMIAMTVCTQG